MSIRGSRLASAMSKASPPFSMKQEIAKKFEEDYASAAPDPKQWRTLVAKVTKQAKECEG